MRKLLIALSVLFTVAGCASPTWDRGMSQSPSPDASSTTSQGPEANPANDPGFDVYYEGGQ